MRIKENNKIKLTLIKKREYKDKDYDLYTICKVIEIPSAIDTKNKKNKIIPLYDETFTPTQIEKFYKQPINYSAVENVEE